MSALSEHYAGKECPGDPIEQKVPVPKVSMFAAWHPVHGFGPVNEIAIREQYDHAKTDVNLLSHTGDRLWTAVAVELKIASPRGVERSELPRVSMNELSQVIYDAGAGGTFEVAAAILTKFHVTALPRS